MWEFDKISALIGVLTILVDVWLFSLFEWLDCRKAKGDCAKCKAWTCRAKQLYYKKRKAGD